MPRWIYVRSESAVRISGTVSVSRMWPPASMPMSMLMLAFGSVARLEPSQRVRKPEPRSTYLATRIAYGRQRFIR